MDAATPSAVSVTAWDDPSDDRPPMDSLAAPPGRDDLDDGEQLLLPAHGAPRP